jgi:hypothetical protein
MIYDMNPFQMPRAFCIGERTGLPAQPPAKSYDAVRAFIIYYWSLTGVCGTSTFATRPVQYYGFHPRNVQLPRAYSLFTLVTSLDERCTSPGHLHGKTNIISLSLYSLSLA